MALVGRWLRLELRRRWRSLLVLALLVAVSAGVVLTAAAGARRGASALDRLLEQTRPATLAVLASTPGFDWDAVRSLPGVAAVGEFGVGTVEVGLDGAPPDLPLRLDPVAVERPVVLEGRLADPARADEAVVTPGFVAAHGRGVGAEVPVRLTGPDGAAGPLVTLRVVGVVRSFVLTDRPSDPPTLHPSTGFVAAHRELLLGPAGQEELQAYVRLERGAAGVTAFQEALVGLTGRTDISYFDLAAQQEKVRRTLAFEGGALLAFASAALAAAAVLVGQAVARCTAAAVADLQVLRALGMPRRHTLVAATGAPAAAALAGVLVGAAGAAVASAWFPAGTAAQYEPDPGPHVDGLVLGLGGVLLVLLATGGAAVTARLAFARRDAAVPRSSAVAALAARAGLPVPVLVGTRFALETGRGRGALPVRPALVGAVTGVVGVLAAFTFSAGVAEAADNPARFGQHHRFAVYLGFFGQDAGVPAGPVLAALAADPAVAAVLDTRDGVLAVRGGDGVARPITVHTGPPPDGHPYPAVLSAGRMPAAPSEIALAPGTARVLGVGVGDAVGADGERGAATLTVTGIGFVPVGPHNFYDDGAWLTPDGHEALTSGFRFHVGLVALRPGVAPEAVADRLAAVAGEAAGVAGPLPLQPVPPLYEAVLLRNVEVLPVVLGGFLALVAVGAVGHALATAVRRRGHDVAVLRALGMTRRQCRGLVVTQAVVLAAVGLLLGVPLGVALGRVLWRAVADLTPLQYAPPVALLALLTVAPVTVAVAAALAAWPGHRATRLRIGHLLRAE